MALINAEVFFQLSELICSNFKIQTITSFTLKIEYKAFQIQVGFENYFSGEKTRKDIIFQLFFF